MCEWWTVHIHVVLLFRNENVAQPWRISILSCNIVALRLLASCFNLRVVILVFYLVFQRICSQELYYSTGIFSHSAHFEAVYLRTLRHIFCGKAFRKSFREVILICRNPQKVVLRYPQECLEVHRKWSANSGSLLRTYKQENFIWYVFVFSTDIQIISGMYKSHTLHCWIS